MSFQHEYPYGDVHELNLDWIMQTMQEFINSEREAGNTPTVSSVRSFFTHKYPYGDIHELNLDWVIQTALRMEEIGDSVEGDIGELQTRIATAETNISTLDNTVSGLSDSIGQIETEMEEIHGDVTALETTVGQHTTQIAALDQKIDEQVVANPADGATDTLSKIEIAGTVYTVEGSGGSEVEANPAGEPTDTLETIGIDGTVYEVGGGSVEPVSKTATGNPIHIEDAADAPIVSGTVAFEPIQDLHGYDKPWAGGAGKNKLPLTVAGIKSVNTGGTWNNNTYTINNGTIEILTDSDDNVIGLKVNGSFSASTLFNTEYFTADGNYFLSGCPSGGSASTYRLDLRDSNSAVIETDTGDGRTVNNLSSSVHGVIRIDSSYTANNLVFYPMIRIATETDPTFEPYSNICPIEGYTDCEVEVTDDATSPTVTNTYTIDLDGTRYDGTVYPVTGKMSVSMGHIASYAGETIGEPWLSDRDEYVAGTTPTTGAEVVYTLASPTIVQLSPQQIRTLQGKNNITTNMSSMSLEYITQDYQPLVELIERSAGHHYSTQERVVGTWFGKPLYEKSWDVSIELPASSANTWVSTGIEISSVNCDGIASGELIDDQNQCISASIGFIQQKTYFAIYSQIGGRTISTITIRYTKTTD